MVTVWNRKELCLTYSMEEQAKVRELLSANGVDYTVTTAGTHMRNVGLRGIGAGRTWENTDWNIEYRIFVKKSDFARAAALLQKTPMNKI